MMIIMIEWLCILCVLEIKNAIRFDSGE